MRNRIAVVMFLLLGLRPLAAALPCVGDCNGNATVTVDELITGVNIALGNGSIASCPAFDLDDSGTITVDELIKGVNAALAGCTAPPPTSTASTEPTEAMTPSVTTTAVASTGTPTIPVATATRGPATPTRTPSVAATVPPSATGTPPSTPTVTEQMTASVADTPTPTPQTSFAFTLFPARLGLGVGDEDLLAPLAAPGAVLWSSSDESVATVDALGRVRAIAKGSAVVSATSGPDVATSTVTVYQTTGANPDPSSEALIAAALAAGRIDSEQALTYRVFALFGDARLPAEFTGAPSPQPDHLLMREVSGRLPTLSPATQTLLLPFLIPPIYQQSWFVQLLQPPTAPPSAASVRRSEPEIPCFVARAGPPQRITAHFNVHANPFENDFPLLDNTGNPGGETVSDFVVSVIEEVYQSETGLFGRYPLPDTNESCNGGGGALDIYLFPGGPPARTMTYPGRCEAAPSYVVLNTNRMFASLGTASDVPLATRKLQWKSIIAHEFLHVLQFAMDRQADCNDYEWFDEATAEWVMDYVDPEADFEDGRQVFPGILRSGAFFANYLYNDHLVPIEAGSPQSEDPTLNGYSDYIFFQYLARAFVPALIKQIYDATESQASVESVASALTPLGGMKEVWPEFAKVLWNDEEEGLFDDLSRWDDYDFGLAAIYSPSGPAQQAAASSKLKALEIDQKGKPRATFKLLDNVLLFPATYYAIEPRSILYESLKFSDPSVRSVYFSNPIASLPNREFMKVQAVKKIGGVWQQPEDWTQSPYKQFCRDKKDERLEELLLIVSNSEVNRGTEEPFRIPENFPMQISTSNVGCWKWQGTASTVQTGGAPFPVDSTGLGTFVTFEVAEVMPGRIAFETTAGLVGGRSVQALGACTITRVGADTVLVKSAMPDGTIDLNLDLDLGFGGIGGEPPNRKLITLSGLSSLSTTETFTCPDFTQSTLGVRVWDWLRVDDPSLYAVSPDGQTIEGEFTAVAPIGVTINTTWTFTAVREQ